MSFPKLGTTRNTLGRINFKPVNSSPGPNFWVKIPRDEVGYFPQSPEFSEVKLPKMRIGIEKVGDEEIKMKRQKLAFTCGKYQLDSNGNVPDSSDRLIFVKRRAKDGRFVSKNTGKKTGKFEFRPFFAAFIQATASSERC